ncbi:MAG: glycoside hydrolase family 78 protein [Promethearchaeota archaeon]
MVYASALGEYELRINGKRVGDHILAPEWTDYNKRVQYQTYDITKLLRDGENVIGVILADGWYSGYLGPGALIHHSFYGVNLRFLLQLIIEKNDGNTKEIITDSDWKIFLDGPIQRADHFMGEIYDTNKEIHGWNNPGFNDSNWSIVTVDNTINIELNAQMNEPIRIVKEIKPVAVNEPKPGVFIYDMGQNIAGWCKIRLNASNCNANSTITLRHGEMLKLDGTLYTTNLRTAKATDKYILKEIKDYEFQPHFTYHGFRYVEVVGLKPNIKPNLDMITGCVIASDTAVVGAFESSDSTLNKLWQNILWTQRDNLISVPTDCPQRDERLGWMGDVQVFCQTSIFNMDMAAFYTKWIRDIRDSQRKDGRFTDFVPYPYNWGPHLKMIGTPAWADCGVIVPWYMYLNYGDKRIIEQHYEYAKRFINYVHSKNPKLIWKKKKGFNYGDWLNGDKIKAKNYPKKGGAIPKDVFATAFFAYSAEILSKMAEILGNIEDLEYYKNLTKKIKEQFTKEFVNEEGKIKGDTQAGYALALNFKLTPKELRSKIALHLVNAIERYDRRISTGFCTTLKMMIELAKYGYIDIAYELLLSKRFPSWFYMIKQGATTMWERWDGYTEERGFQNKWMNSFNHYAYGSVGEFLYRVILGINFDENFPGFKHIIIKPRPGGNLMWAKGHYNSIHGEIICDWRIEESTFTLEVLIPPNTTATIYLPAKNSETVTESGKLIQELKDIEIISFEKNIICIKVKSGKYKFSSLYPS